MNAAELVRRQCLARTPLADFFRILLSLFRIPDCREIMFSMQLRSWIFRPGLCVKAFGPDYS